MDLTVIVGFLAKDGPWIGADSAASVGDESYIVSTEPKVWRCGELALGWGGSSRPGQLLRVLLEQPEVEEGIEPADWVISKLVPAMRKILQADECMPDDCTFLVYFRRRFFLVDHDWGVVDAGQELAIGDGDMAANGALAATRGVRDSKKRMERILEAVASCVPSVRGPWTILGEK